MNKIALISISLLLLVIGIGCAAAADLNVNDAPLGGSLGGGGDQNLFAPACVDDARPLNNVVNDSVVDDARPLNNVVNDSVVDDSARVPVIGAHVAVINDDLDHPLAVASSGPNIFNAVASTGPNIFTSDLPAALGSSGLGGGGNQNFF